MSAKDNVKKLLKIVSKLTKKARSLEAELARYTRGLSEARDLMKKVPEGSEEHKALQGRIDKHQFMRGVSETDLKECKHKLEKAEYHLRYQKLLLDTTSGEPLTYRPFEVLRNFKVA